VRFDKLLIRKVPRERGVLTRDRFGCGLSSSGTANYCQLVDAEGPLVYGSEYLSCSSRSLIDESNIHPLPPPPGAGMWLFGEGSSGVVGFLANGDR